MTSHTVAELMVDSTIGEIPADWNTATFGDLFDIQQGKALNKKAREGPSPKLFLRTANVFWGELDLNKVDQMSFDAKEEAKYELIPGDLLVCEGGEIGRTAMTSRILSMDPRPSGVICCTNRPLARVALTGLLPRNCSDPLFERRRGSGFPQLLAVSLGAGGSPSDSTGSSVRTGSSRLRTLAACRMNWLTTAPSASRKMAPRAASSALRTVPRRTGAFGATALEAMRTSSLDSFAAIVFSGPVALK